MSNEFKTCGTLLCLHGFLGQPEDWQPVLRHLTGLTTWKVRCLSLWEDIPITDCASMSEWLDRLASRCASVSQLVLCGYSLGARLAMAFACRHPHALKALVAISGHPGLLTESDKRERRADDRRWGQIFLEKPWTEAISQWNRRPVFRGHEIHPDPGSFSVEKLKACLELFSLGAQPDLRPCLQQLDLPILWVVGEEDTKFLHLAKEDWIRHSSIVVKAIPSCGHRIPYEKPTQLALLLNSFFAQAGVITEKAMTAND